VAVAGSEIVAVDPREQLLRFPLSGGRAEPAVAITGLPASARTPLPKGVFADAVGATPSTMLRAWPIDAGASDVWGDLVLVSLDGRYLRTVGPPGKTSGAVSLGRSVYGGVAMAPDDQSALLSEVSEISACEEGRQPRPAPPHQGGKRQLSERARTQGHRCGPNQPCDRFGR